MALIDLPGGAELWNVDGTFYAVYTVPGTDVPLMFAFDRKGMLEEHSTDDTPEADKTLTMQQARARGAQVFGSVAEIQLTTEHPWDGFLSQIERDKDIMPWLEDPEVVAHYGSAWLRGTSPNLENTEWWQSRTDQERQWLQEAAANPTQARQQLEDTRRTILDALQQSGVSNVTDNVANLIADNVTRGHWSQSYAEQQLRRLSDPFAPGEVDPELRREMSQIGAGGDRQAREQGPEAVRSRIEAIYRNRGVPTPPNIDRQVDRVMDEGPDYLRQIRAHADNDARELQGRPGGFEQT
ncbi:MAG: hypothetical protein ACOCUN_01385, partial [Jiangellaceae bacterium]